MAWGLRFGVRGWDALGTHLSGTSSVIPQHPAWGFQGSPIRMFGGLGGG